MHPIPYGRQDIDDGDIEAVVAALRSDWITQGPAIERFERAVAEYCGARHAVAVSSATAGLHIAYQAAGLGRGDAVWTSPNTFVATANAGRYLGAEVDFVDIDPPTRNLSTEGLAAKLESGAREGRLPKVVAPVHFAGESCDMAPIRALSVRYGFKVVEDASHAIGGSYRGRRVGDCAHSDMTVFSFHPVKIVTTAEGGMVLTNDDMLHEALLRLRSHGITRNPAHMRSQPHGPWYYEQLEMGYNYRMTDLQAALGASQMRRIDDFVERRHRIADFYDTALRELPLSLPVRSAFARSALHLYVVHVPEGAPRGRREVFDSLREAGIQVNVHYIPVHLQPYYADLGFREGDFPQAERHYRQAISLPMYPGLDEADLRRVVGAVKAALHGG